jgi:hypothetical protein
MNRNDRDKLVKERFLEKYVEIVLDLQGMNGYIGKKGKVVDIQAGDHSTMLRVEGENLNIWMYISEIELIPEEAPIPHKEKQITFLPKTIENVDEWGNSYIIHLLPNSDEKFIYLSTALRTLLNIKDGEYISFAVDTENKLYYICKENDSNNGYKVEHGKIESNVEWRNLYNTFNNEKTKPNDGKLILHVSHYEREQDEFPDYSLFLINESWEMVKKAKDVKISAKSYFDNVYKPQIKMVDWGIDNFEVEVDKAVNLIEEPQIARIRR